MQFEIVNFDKNCSERFLIISAQFEQNLFLKSSLMNLEPIEDLKVGNFGFCTGPFESIVNVKIFVKIGLNPLQM